MNYKNYYNNFKNIYWVDSSNIKYQDKIKEDINHIIKKYNEQWLNESSQNEINSDLHIKFNNDIEYMFIKNLKIQTKKNTIQTNAKTQLLIESLKNNIIFKK